jgi:flagellar biosynthesis/type III secretory pathway protein FliH
MNDKNLERKANNLLDNVNDTIILLAKKIEELEQHLIDLEKLYEQVKSDKDESFEKGFEEGVKHINQLIMSNERFPF